MTMQHRPRNDDHGFEEQAFDERARGLHRQALQTLPPALQRRVTTARAGAEILGMRWWQPTLALASVAALAIGVVSLQRGPHPPATGKPVVVASGAAASNTTVAAAPSVTHEIASYDNDPEFYAWLADAPAIASKER